MSDPAPEPDVAQAVRCLEGSGGTMFASELASRCGVAGDQASALLRRLESRGLVVVVDHPAPDPCLAEADLRVAAAIEGDDDEEARRAAVERAESLWSSWLGRFLGSHRCL